MNKQLEERLNKIKLLDTIKLNDVWNSWKFVPSKELKDFITSEKQLSVTETVDKVKEIIEKLPKYEMYGKALETDITGVDKEVKLNGQELINIDNLLQQLSQLNIKQEAK